MKKKIINAKGFAKVLLFAMVISALSLAVNPVNTQAAKRITANPRYKKAPVMPKKGTYLVTAKKNNSYTVFKAPKAATYTISISNIKTIGGENPDHNLGNLYPQKISSSGTYPTYIDVPTNGGKSDCLFTATQASYNAYYRDEKVNKNTYLANRYFKVRLKKGEKIYMKYFYTDNKCTYTLTVK